MVIFWSSVSLSCKNFLWATISLKAHHWYIKFLFQEMFGKICALVYMKVLYNISLVFLGRNKDANSANLYAWLLFMCYVYNLLTVYLWDQKITCISIPISDIKMSFVGSMLNKKDTWYQYYCQVVGCIICKTSHLNISPRFFGFFNINW